MNVEEFNSFCASLPHSNHVIQWGGAHVWKVAGKVFAVGGWAESEDLAVTFKVSALGFEVLREQAGLRPAPYLASRGMTWIQRVSDETMDDEELKSHIVDSHRLVALKLSKKIRLELGL